MPDPSFATAILQRHLDRWHAGDLTARDELFRLIHGRLEVLALQMLRKFPHVAAYVDADDVFQEASLRLTRSLESLRPSSTRDFFGLAAVQVRRALLDLARYHGRRERAGQSPPGATRGAMEQVPSDEPSSSDLDRWRTFHEVVEQLPVEEREVVSLSFYHNWTHVQIGELLGVSEKTVQRRWRSALWKIGERCAPHDPPAQGNRP